MNVLIVDHREKWSRASLMKDALERAGHSVERVAHVDGVTDGSETIRSWNIVRSRALAVAASRDCVLLHVGDDQSFHLEFLGESCVGVPVLCYSGGSAADDVIAQCRRSGIHVVYPHPIDDVPSDSAIAQICRWVAQVKAAGTNRDAVHRACQSIEGFDPTSEDKLQLLSAILRGSSPTQIDVLKQRLGVERECTVENLKDLRNELFSEC